MQDGWKKVKPISVEELLGGDEPIPYEPPRIIKKWKLKQRETWGSVPRGKVIDVLAGGEVEVREIQEE